MLPERGGGQGDYRQGIRAKISNAIECLKTEPLSKRAVSWPAGVYLQSSCFTFSFSTARCRSSPSRSTRRAAKRWTGRCKARQSVLEARFLPSDPVLTPLLFYCTARLFRKHYIAVLFPRLHSLLAAPSHLPPRNTLVSRGRSTQGHWHNAYAGQRPPSTRCISQFVLFPFRAPLSRCSKSRPEHF
jgi:hypothetical protein